MQSFAGSTFFFSAIGCSHVLRPDIFITLPNNRLTELSIVAKAVYARWHFQGHNPFQWTLSPHRVTAKPFAAQRHRVRFKNRNRLH